MKLVIRKGFVSVLLCLLLVFSGFSFENTAEAAQSYGYVNSEFLNIRKGPSTSYEIAGKIYTGDMVVILGTSGDWYQVKGYHGSSVLSGYVAKRYITSGIPAGTRGYVNYSFLNLRSAASTSASLVVKLSRYDSVTIKKGNGSWFYVSALHEGRTYTGYVSSEYITFGSAPKAVLPEKGYANTEDLNVRERPTTSSGIVTVLKKYEIVKIKSKTGSWYQVDAYHLGKIYEGYVYASYINSGSIPAGLKGYVNYSKLNLRKKAGTSYSVIVSLSQNDKVKVLSSVRGWLKISAEHKGKTYTGYVSERYITIGNPQTVNPGKSNGKTIYLTFDDGPGAYTQKLLDVLAKYNVKATFFVTNQFPRYQDMIAKEAKAGHTVAIHTYSHDYSRMYTSQTAYFNDLDRMNDIIYAQTGKRSKILRFPGGSSNGVSRAYCEGLMTRLVKAVEDKGFVYCDWNVDSGDAEGKSDTASVIKRVKEGCAAHTNSVVLQHDIKSYSVDAVEEILKWGIKEGYTFKAMTQSSGIIHHSHLNN